MDIETWAVPLAVIILQFAVILVAKSLGSETASKSKKNYHFARKIQHCSTGLAIFLFKRKISQETVILAALVGFIFIAMVELLRKIHPKLNQTYIQQAGVLMRDHEKQSLSTAFYFLLGVLISVCLYPREISDLIILFVSFGDPMASVVGISIQSPKVIGKKSIAGICGCALTCFVISTLYHQGLLVKSLLCGLIGALSEVIQMPGVDDNLSMQILAGPLLYIVLT